tara:strand:- start:1322 stop:2569 length:1248 start_codon:yes stop_codon:yes gene_type:complete
MKTILLSSFLLFLSHAFAQEIDSITNLVFRSTIKTVQLYPHINSQQNEILPASLDLKQIVKLELHFDDLNEEFYNYAIKIVHCNRDWHTSQLVASDYLDEYNEFLIEEITPSFGTQRPYSHYMIELPRVNRSGNYGVIVYDTDTEEIVAVRRFLIFEESVTITPKTTYSDVRNSKGKQSFGYTIDYGNKDLDTPTASIHVTMKQNDRWDNAKHSLEPFTVNDAAGKLTYAFLNDDEQFYGGNEFRMFDARSVNFSGKNIAIIDDTKLPAELYVAYEESRDYHTYKKQYDINGSFLIDHYEYGDGVVNSDYVYVHFTLEYSIPNQSIFVIGALTDWRINSNYKMRYNKDKKRYEGRALLKQGYYNYQYVIGHKDEVKLEGTFSQTENLYEIIVYYRPFGIKEDVIIGYKAVHLNMF